MNRLNLLPKYYKMPKLVKVWSHDRKVRKAVLVEDENVLQNCLMKASKKLNVNGKYIVLEANGTEVDEDEIFKIFIEKGEIFMLLDEQHSWQPPTRLVHADENISHNEEKNNIIESEDGNASINQIEEVNSSETESEEPNPENSLLLQPSQSKVETTANNTSSMWHDFSIKWNLLSESAIKRLEKLNRGEKVDGLKDLQYNLINDVVYQMRTISSSIPNHVLKKAAQEIITKFPNIYRDQDDRGQIIGDGCHSTINALRNRNYNVSRPKCGTNLSAELGINSRTLRKLQKAKSGCIKWQPELQLPLDVAEEKRLSLKEWWTKKSNESEESCDNDNDAEKREEEKVDTDFLYTFPNQRKLLNVLDTPPTIQDVFNKWPILFHDKYFLWHFKVLTGKSMELFDERFETYKNVIFEYGHKIKKCDSSENSPETVVHTLMNIFNEDFNMLFTIYSDETEHTDFNIPEHFAWFARNEKSDFYFFMQEHNIFLGCSFTDCIKFYIAAHYIYNKVFPKEFSYTLDFIQRCFLNIYPESESKSSKQSKEKVLNLIMRLNKLLRKIHENDVPENDEPENDVPENDVLENNEN